MLLSLIYAREWIVTALKDILPINSSTRISSKKKFRDVHKIVQAIDRNVYYNVIYN